MTYCLLLLSRLSLALLYNFAYALDQGVTQLEIRGYKSLTITRYLAALVPRNFTSHRAKQTLVKVLVFLFLCFPFWASLLPSNAFGRAAICGVFHTTLTLYICFSLVYPLNIYNPLGSTFGAGPHVREDFSFISYSSRQRLSYPLTTHYSRYSVTRLLLGLRGTLSNSDISYR